MEAWTRYISATLFTIIGAGIYGLTWAGGGIVGGIVLLALFFMLLFFAFINLCYFIPGIELAKIKYVMLSVPLALLAFWEIDWIAWNKDVINAMTTIAVFINGIMGLYFFFRQLNQDTENN